MRLPFSFVKQLLDWSDLAAFVHYVQVVVLSLVCRQVFSHPSSVQPSEEPSPRSASPERLVSSEEPEERPSSRREELLLGRLLLLGR